MKKTRQIYQGKCPWRKEQIKRAACRLSGSRIRLRRAAGALLALEAAALVPISLREQGMAFYLIRQEEYCQAEWILPGEAGPERQQDIYGLRFHPGTWELQFYHRQEKLEPESGALGTKIRD